MTDELERIAVTDEELVAGHFQRAARQRDCTAFHEAGHVCAFHWLGVALRGATVKPGFRFLGRAYGPVVGLEDRLAEARDAVLNGRPVKLPTRKRVETLCMTLMAGGLAEDRAVAEGRALVVRDPVPDDSDELARFQRTRFLEEAALVVAAREAGETSNPSDEEQVDRLLTALSATDAEILSYRAWLGRGRERSLARRVLGGLRRGGGRPARARDAVRRGVPSRHPGRPV